MNASTKRIPIATRGTYGLYAGVVRGMNGAEDYALELLEADPKEEINWADAKKWAESVGGELPSRREAALLFTNLSDQFERDWYWTSEQYESDPSYAWCQSFGNGYQRSLHESSQLRARAVRRLPLPQ